MGAKAYSTVYRVQGIPLEYRKKQLKEALASIFTLEEKKNGVQVHSLAPNYIWSRPLKVATVTFSTEIEVLPEGKKEASFLVPTDELATDDDDDDYTHRIRLKLDIQFEGLTPLRTFKDERDHLIE